MTGGTVLLTGGTGFLGRHVARVLIDEGWALRVLARQSASAEIALAELPVDIVLGDIARDSDLDAAARGCHAVVHLAGVVAARTLEEYRRVNVRGTERLVQAARRSAPEAFFLYVSSLAAVGPARAGRPVREGDEPRPVSWHGASKLEAEEVVRREWPGPWIVLRPGAVYGPGDRGLLVYFQLAESGWLPVPAGLSRFQVAHVNAVALAVGRAVVRPDLAGRRGFLCDPESIRMRDFAAAVAGLRRPPARLLNLPHGLVRIAGVAATLRQTLTRRAGAFNADKAREILAGDWICDGDPMRRDLGLPPPVPLAEGLRETREWYLAQGWLKS